MSGNKWELALWLGQAGHLSSPGPFQSHRCRLSQQREQRHREMGSSLPPRRLVGLGTPLLRWAVLVPRALPRAGTAVRGRGAMRGAGGGDTQEAHGSNGDVTSPTADHQLGRSLAVQGSPAGSCARGEAPRASDRRWGTGGRLCHRVTGRSGAGQGRWCGGERQGDMAAPSLRAGAGSGAVLPLRAGPSIRHAALSAGSLLSPRQ